MLGELTGYRRATRALVAVVRREPYANASAKVLPLHSLEGDMESL